MKVSRVLILILTYGGLSMLFGLQSCKHDPITINGQDSPNPATQNPSPNPTTSTTLDGATLYTSNCVSCHGTLESSTKQGASASLIQTGISKISDMKFLSFLTSAQIKAIADTLKNIFPTPIPTLDGATLYNNNCVSCHGSLATSTKLGATASQIQTGISTVSGMKIFSSLTAAQIQAIANALKTTTPIPTPTDGATLYTNYCSSCHGLLASSAKIGASVSRIQNAIGSVSAMSSLSSLTSAQIQAISNALTSTPMPTDGTSLYTINCFSCHGALANSQVGGSSVSDIQQAINEKSKMRYLSTLTLIQIQAIAGVLANVKGGGDK